MSWLSKLAGGAASRAPENPQPEPLAEMLTDPGCHRAQNEDSARIVHAGADRGLLIVVADGMGGHEAGEVASLAAVEVIEKEYRETRGSPGEALLKAFREAHTRIYRMATANTAMKGMGTTCTALVIEGGRAWAAHVGDTRLYLVRNGQIYQLSEDHTQCMELVRRGLMSLEDARKREDRNVLVRAMGTRPEVAPQTWVQAMQVEPGDAFVLCTDGLHDLVADEEIRGVVDGAAPMPACRQLVQMARERGGYDNITVVIAQVPASGTVSAPLAETRQYEVHP
jgi:PPM family protein phosphatase